MARPLFGCRFAKPRYGGLIVTLNLMVVVSLQFYDVFIYVIVSLSKKLFMRHPRFFEGWL